jgi:3-carboxy-cis,cis-muconate cycloisomerase
MRLIEPLARWHVLDEVFSDGARIAAMLAFEAALARAEARVGVIPQAAADAIGRQCAARSFDHAALARDAARAGNVAIPLVDRLRIPFLSRRFGQRRGEGTLHRGASLKSQLYVVLTLDLAKADIPPFLVQLAPRTV